MGKRLGVQRRGKGSPAWRTPDHRFKYTSAYPTYSETEKEGIVQAEIIDLLDDVARTTPIAKILCEDNVVSYVLAPEGIFVGQLIELGTDSKVSIGNILPLKSIPEGIPIFNVENTPGDGGRTIKSSGAFSYIVSRAGNKVTLKLSSGKFKTFHPNCRATIGNAAGGGRTEKPMLKAGAQHHKMKARNKRFPKVRGVAMNPVSHPHGGTGHHAGKSTTVSRHAPPGQKVGHIAAKRTGRRKR
ncbi:MAG: 50S ribosomal protein L2 [Candidatus Diapherotrites archaeon]|nr:50S ribosomal protein L2 [Candidatus Diapherotrites archaeon]